MESSIEIQHCRAACVYMLSTWMYCENGRTTAVVSCIENVMFCSEGIQVLPFQSSG